MTVRADAARRGFPRSIGRATSTDSPARRKILLAAAIASLLPASLLSAATTYSWDPGKTPTAASGGTGTWDAANSFWSTGTADVIWPNSASYISSFGGTAGAVTVQAAGITTGGLNVTTPGYTFSGGTLTIGGTAVGTFATGGTTTFTNSIVNSGALTYLLSPTDTVVNTGSFTATGGITVNGLNGGTTNFSGYFNGNGGFTVGGNGSLTTANFTSANASTNKQYTGVQAGTMNISAGSFGYSYAANSGDFYIGAYGTAGTLNLSGGTFSVTSLGNILIGNGYNGTGKAGSGSYNTIELGTAGQLTLSGSGYFTTGTNVGTFGLGNETDNGTIELDSGATLATLRTFLVLPVLNNVNAAGATLTPLASPGGIFNFNGGTLLATGSTLGFTVGGGSLTIIGNVRNGGVVFNSNGFNNTLAQPFTHSAVSGDNSIDGGFNKYGTGITTLTGTNTYTGATTVNGGTLRSGNASSIPAGTGLSVAAGTFDLGGQYAATSLSLGSLNVASGGVLNFDLTTTSADSLVITGAASTTGGKISIGAIGTSISTGTYTLASGSLGNLSGFTLASNTLAVNGTNYALSLASGVNSDILTVSTGAITTFYYTGSQNGTLNYSTGSATNFSSDAAGATIVPTLPGATSDVVFTASTASNLSPTLGANLTYNSLTFNTSNAVTLNGAGNTLTLNATTAGLNGVGTAILVTAGAPADTINANLALGSSASFINNGTNTFTVTGNVALGTFSLTAAGTGPTSITGTIGGTGGLTVGGGTVSLAALNTYSGPTTISGGLLNAATFGGDANPGALGASTNVAANLVLGGGTLQYTGSASATTDRLLTLGYGTSNLGTIDSSGTGSLSFTNPGAIAFNNSAAHTLNFVGTSTGANTFTPAIGDQGTGATTSIAKSGVGEWVLAGSNSYSGGTAINAGTLVGGSTGALGSGGITIANGAYLVDSATNASVNSTTVGISDIAAGAAGTGGLQLTGGITIGTSLVSLGARNDPASNPGVGPQLESVSGNNTFSGNIAQNGGGGSGILIESDAGTLTISGNLLGNTSGSAYARPYYLYGAGNGVISGTIANGPATNTAYGSSITKEGTGTWTFTNADSYYGPTAVIAGTLTVDSSSIVSAALTNTAGVTVSAGATFHLVSIASAKSTSMVSDAAIVNVLTTGGSAPTGVIALDLNGAVETVATFQIDGTAQTSAVYGSAGFVNTYYGGSGNVPAYVSADESYFTGNGGLGAGVVVPEPGTASVIGLGFGALFARRRRRA